MARDDDNPWGERKQDKPSGPAPRPFSDSIQKPDLQDMWRKTQKILKNSGKGGGALPVVGVILALLGLWLATGIYRIQPSERAVVLRFGQAVRVADAGLNYHLPYPIESVWVRDVTAVNRVDSGVSPNREGPPVPGSDAHSTLTGDENLVDLHFTVLWVVKDVERFLFNARAPEETVRFAAESVVREIVAQMPMSEILTQGRAVINQKAQLLLQQLLDQYGLGIQILEVIMGRIDPPSTVIDAYRNVQRAKTTQQRMINEAIAYENSEIPNAQGKAQKMVLAARGYAAQMIAASQGQASRFLSVYSEYKLAPEIVRYRLWLDTVTASYQGKTKVIMDRGSGVGPGAASGGSGVVPYLPLPALKAAKPVPQEPDHGSQPSDEGDSHGR